jgi:hypothetical protein
MFNKLQSLIGRVLTIFGGAGSIFSGFLLMRGGLLMPIYWGIFVGSLTAFFVGWNLATSGDKSGKQKAAVQKQQTVLGVVKALNGRVTDLQLAAESGWTLEESKRVLNDFVNAGAAEMNVTPEGDLVYVFRGMLQPGQVERARQPMSFTVETEDVIET